MKLLKIFRRKPTKYQQLLGFPEKDPSIYDRAFSHKSMQLKDENGRKCNNERLEFLGDAVIETVASEYVYQLYPNRNEGFLTQTRSFLVRRQTLNLIAGKIGLHKYVISKQIFNSDNFMGNAFEALIGAIYIDKGFESARDFLLRSFTTIKIEQLIRKQENYKSELLEYAQKKRVKVLFNLLDESKLENNVSRFKVDVTVDGTNLGQGIGKSKRAAEQAAAKVALRTLKSKQCFNTSSKTTSRNMASTTQP